MSIDSQTVISELVLAVPEATCEAGAAIDVTTVYVSGEHIVEACRALRDSPAMRFNVLVEVTAADYFPRDPRFEVVYHLLSIPNRQRLRVKVRVAEGGSVPTVQQVWPAAGWLEREVWDMFGVVFSGHPDLRRLLMPEDWEGHPQRKDYPVQIRKAPQTYEPLEISEDEFKANLERDRVTRTH
jgi:NADH-quinone oxidoreductase subunit C